MPVNFACPRCMKHLSIAARKAGAEVSCPACNQLIIVPTPEPPKPPKPLPGILIESTRPPEPSAHPESDRPQIIEREPDREPEPEPVRSYDDDDYDPVAIRRRQRRGKLVSPSVLFGVSALALVAVGMLVFALVRANRIDRDAAKATEKSGPKQASTRQRPQPTPEAQEERDSFELPHISAEEVKIRASYGLKTLAVIGGYSLFVVGSIVWVNREAMRKKRDAKSSAASAVLRGVVAGCVIGCGVGIAFSQYWPVFTSVIPFERMADPWSPARIDSIPIHVLVFGSIGAICGGVGCWLVDLSKRSGRP